MRLIVPIVVALGSFALGRWTFTAYEGGARSSAVASTANANTPLAQPPQSITRLSLDEVFAGEDPFSAAVRAQEWVDSATLADLRRLAANSESLERRFWEWHLDSFFLDALAARWIALDPEGAIPAMKPIAEMQEKREDTCTIYTAAAQLRPTLILDEAALINKSGHLSQATDRALQVLASKNANAARRYLDRFTEPGVRREAEISIAKGMAENDPVVAVTMSQRLNAPDLIEVAVEKAEKLGVAEIQRVLTAAAGHLEEIDLPRLLIKHPDLASLTGVGAGKPNDSLAYYRRAAAQAASPEERERLLEQYDSLPAETRESLGAVLAVAWARTEPQKAAEWALAYADPVQDATGPNLAADKVFVRWFTQDPKAAFAWWQALPPSKMRESLGNDVSTYVADAGEIDRALELFHPHSDADWMIATQLAQTVANKDPAKAANWLAALPDATNLQDAAKSVIAKWYPRQPGAVAQWVEGLPPGRLRDQAMDGYILEIAQQSPPDAANHLDSIDDRELRLNATERVYGEWRATDPKAARNWLAQVDTVDEVWRARMLRN